VEQSNISLPDLVVLELPGQVAEGLGSAGQEDDPARLPVQAVDRMNPEQGIIIDFVPEVRVILDLGPKDGTEIPSRLLLDAQPGGLLHYEPALVRREDWNRKRVRCHREKEWEIQSPILMPHSRRAPSNHENYCRLRIGLGSRFRLGLGVRANFLRTSNLTH